MWRNRLFLNVYRTLKFNWLLNKKSNMNEDSAYSELQTFLKRERPKFEQNNTIVAEFDLMIIVPVYNTGKFLKQCIDSVLNQKTHYTYQAIFINDGSTDDSKKILSDMVKPPHRIISIDNSGCSVARNIALKQITGRYTMFLDSDDYLQDESVEKLMRIAELYSADIVEGGFASFDTSRISGFMQHSNIVKENSAENLFGFPCGKVIKSELLKKFCFPEGYYFEDTVMSTLLYPRARVIYTIPDIIYFYRDNPQGITHTSESSKKAIDSFWMMKYCLEERFRRNNKITPQIVERYIISVWRNWIRMKSLPDHIKECVFMLTSLLFDDNISVDYQLREKRARMLEKAMKKRSYLAYVFVLDRWDIL